MSKHGREVASIEAWVRKGVAEGWCKPVPSHDVPGRFRRKFAADLAMNCEDPPTVEVWGRYDRTGKQVRAIFVDVKTRCRKCEACLEAKARYWTARAMDEFARSQATWLLTLTLRPEMHYYLDARMQQPLYRGKTMVRDKVGPFNGLAPATLFRLRAREAGYEVTDLLKRIRKNRGPFRYLLVAERHMEDPNSEVFGRPHFHVLLHEVDTPLCHPNEWQEYKGLCTAACKNAGRLIYHKSNGMAHDHAMIRQSWKHGWNSLVRCVDVRSAVYVCKYVSKDPMARVRASIGYGKDASVKTGDLACDTRKSQPMLVKPSEGGFTGPP